MAKSKKPRTAPRKKEPVAPAYPTPLDVRFFPTTAGVTEEIQAWAAREGVKIRAIVPIYWEGI